MKKLFFVATLCVAGFASANSQIEGPTKKVEEQKSLEVENAKTGCFPFTLSCGVSGTACGDSVSELIDLILIVDKDICGK